jgi:hypothetical protein
MEAKTRQISQIEEMHQNKKLKLPKYKKFKYAGFKKSSTFSFLGIK